MRSIDNVHVLMSSSVRVMFISTMDMSGDGRVLEIFTVAILAQAQAHCSFLMPCRSSSVKVFLTSLSSILNS